jgi:hypothetical protein
MVKNNQIITQTWGILVTHMYFPIEVSFSMSKKDEEAGEDIDVGHDLAEDKARKVLDMIWDGVTPEFMYTFDLELDN